MDKSRLALVGGADWHASVKNKFVWLLLVAAIVASAAVGTGLYHAGASLRDLRASELKPIAALLKDDEELLRALQTAATLGETSGVLGSYLAKIS